MLHNWGYRQTLRMSNIYCFYMAAMVLRTLLDVTSYLYYVYCSLSQWRTWHGTVQTLSYRNSCTKLYLMIPVCTLDTVHRNEVVSICAFTTHFMAHSPFSSKSSSMRFMDEEARCAGLPANYSTSLYLPHFSWYFMEVFWCTYRTCNGGD